MQPNIIFLMADQYRWDALGVMNPLVKTPNLDRLARRGVLFDQAVCNIPMCVPSRYSMMTGVYGSQGGLRYNTQVCLRDSELPMPALAQRLRDAGYQTAGFGKTHWALGNRVGRDMRWEPSTRGFEVRAVQASAGSGQDEPGARLIADEIPEGYRRLNEETAPFGPGQENILGYTGCTSTVPSEHHREGWLADKALEFLGSGRDPGRPLFLYLSFDYPHAGFNVPAGYEDLYDIADIPDRPLPPWESQPTGHVSEDYRTAEWKKKTPEARRRTTLRYFALCSYVDDLFGKILDKLESMGERSHSILLFTSDHGEMLGDRGHRFGKYCLYEGSIRVPLIIAGTAVPEDRRGTIDSRPAELVDVVPTLMDAAGIDRQAQLSGHSLLGTSLRHGTFSEMHGGGYTPIQEAPAICWRTKEWKLILSIPGDARNAEARIDTTVGELYSLIEDPGEWTNRFNDPSCAATRDRLTRDLLMHLVSVWARFPFMPARAKL